MVNLKSPCCASKSQPERTIGTSGIDVPFERDGFVATPHGHGLP